MLYPSLTFPILDSEQWNVVKDFLIETNWTSYLAMLAQWGLAAAAGVAGAWAVYTYRRARNTSAASWLEELFRNVYLGDSFRSARMKMEYHFLEEIAPVLQKRITNRNAKTSKDEESILIELDNFLNMFEFILHLENKKQISRQDTFTIFRYWFYGLIKYPAHALLRYYIKEFGFNNIASLIDETEQKYDYIFVYGTIRDETNPIRDEIERYVIMNQARPAVTAGFLYEFREGERHFPMLQVLDQKDSNYIDRSTVVHGCVVPIRDSDSSKKGRADQARLGLLKLLDDEEGFKCHKPEDASLLVRRRIRVYMAKGGKAKLRECSHGTFLENDENLMPVDAWVYVLSSHFPHRDRLVPIRSGDWLKEMKAG